MEIFKKYTKERKGGICWWDIKRTDCAICKQYVNAMPCGYPLHNYCYKKSRQGCPKIPNFQYTLSTTGYPCYWDHSDKSCAWCADGAFQCGPGQETGPESKLGSRCDKGKHSAKICLKLIKLGPASVATVLLVIVAIFLCVMLTL